MTAHVDLNELLTIGAVTVVHVLPLLQQGVDFVPIGTSLESQGVGERRRTQSPLQHKALSKLASGDQLVISTAGPRDKPTWWRKSTRTVLLTGGMIQSGTITDIDSRVGPANTNVPNTAKSAVPAKRRFADYGSNPISASSCPYAFRRTPSPSVSSVNDPVY